MSSFWEICAARCSVPQENQAARFLHLLIAKVEKCEPSEQPCESSHEMLAEPSSCSCFPTVSAGGQHHTQRKAGQELTQPSGRSEGRNKLRPETAVPTHLARVTLALRVPTCHLTMHHRKVCSIIDLPQLGFPQSACQSSHPLLARPSFSIHKCHLACFHRAMAFHSARLC